MIISYSRRFIFLKTRKTAGSSIQMALSEICGNDDIIVSDDRNINSKDIGRNIERSFSRNTHANLAQIRLALGIQLSLASIGGKKASNVRFQIFESGYRSILMRTTQNQSATSKLTSFNVYGKLEVDLLLICKPLSFSKGRRKEYSLQVDMKIFQMILINCAKHSKQHH